MSLAMIGIIGGTPQSKARNDDDWADKLSHRFTVSLLIVFAILVTTSQYVGDAIHCWVPAHFSGSWEDYTNSYCWIKNTYYLPFDDHIPKAEEPHDHIQYYQWVPLILLFQAILFYLPCAFWRALNTRSGIDVNSMVESAQTFHYGDKIAEKESVLTSLVEHTRRFLLHARRKDDTCTIGCSDVLRRIGCCCGRRHGNYLIVLYIITKILYIVNAIGQLYMIDRVLGRNFHSFGIDAIVLWSNGSDINPMPRFPRVTMCDFYVRILGNVQRYTVFCTIPINLYHEKVFLIIWFWIVMVAIVTVFCFLSWLGRLVFNIDQHRYMKNHLRFDIPKDVPDRRQRTKRLVNFVEKYLRSDGVFVLRLIAVNTDAITTTDIGTALWEDYQRQQDELNGEKSAIEPLVMAGPEDDEEEEEKTGCCPPIRRKR